MEFHLSRRKLPAPRYPLGAELALVRGLRALARAARDDVLALVNDRLPALLALAARDVGRTDAESADQPAEQTGWAAALAALMALAASRVAVRLSAARALIAEARRAVNAHMLRQWRRTLLAAYGVDSLGPGREPALGPLFAVWEDTTEAAIRATGDAAIGRLRAAIVRAATAGATARDATAEARDALDAEGRVENVARLSVAQLVGQIGRARQTAANIPSFQWRTMADERVRPAHRARNGRVFRWDDPGPKPGSEPRCRCMAVAVLPQKLLVTAA